MFEQIAGLSTSVIQTNSMNWVRSIFVVFLLSQKDYMETNTQTPYHTPTHSRQSITYGRYGGVQRFEKCLCIPTKTNELMQQISNNNIFELFK